MIHVVVTVDIRPDCVVYAFLQMATSHAAQSRLEPGCIRFDVLQDMDRPLRFVLLESFKDRDALKSHQRTSHYARWRAEIGKYEASPRTHEEYVPRGTIVFTNGCFDGPELHAGHLHLLKEAAKLGTELIVALNSDRSVWELKGMGRPVASFEERRERLEALPHVSRVVWFDSEVYLEEILRKIRPEVLVKASEWCGKELTGQQYAGRVHFIERLPGISTTSILKAMSG